MTHKTLFLIIILTAITTWSFAQENRTEGGMKVGRWTLKDKKDLVYAEGSYKDNARTGRWLFYVSPISRYTNVPDVKGSYTDAGKKTGSWSFISATTKISVSVDFVNDLMEGTCTYYSENGNMIATGLMNAGIRHGKWIFYYNNQVMTEGYYQNGIKIGDWVYDYYPEKETHIKGSFNFDNGVKNGKLEYYRVENHPKFGIEELLSGIGTYTNDLKTGRWIEYKQEAKKEFVETGNYNRNGKREGFWKATIGRKNYLASSYENGLLHGVFKQYHDNGKLQNETTYEKGSPIGDFVRYYDNGSIEEKGKTTYSPNPKDVLRDTIYQLIELPYETIFYLIEADHFHKMDHYYADWISDPSYSIEPAELDRRFKNYKEYSLEPKKRIVEIKIKGKKIVREGPYESYYTNGQLKLEGTYYPQMSDVFNPETNTILVDYARDGEWKQYDDNGYLMRVFTYDKGKLLKVVDDKGDEIGVNDAPKNPE